MDTVQGWRENLSEDKLAATVLYLLRGCAPMRPGLTSLLKMIWFADYTHYLRHLSVITGGRYVALQNGPVLDNYKNLFESLERKGFLSSKEVPVQGRDRKKVEYVALVEPDEDLFTETELEVLDEVIRECGHKPGSALSVKTHGEGPWPIIWNPLEPGRHIPYIAFRWLENLPDEEDMVEAEKELTRAEVAQEIERLNRQATG